VDEIRLFGADELKPCEKRAVSIGNVAVVVLRKRDGSYRVLRDRCMHQGRPLSRGSLQAKVVSEQVGCYALSPDRDILRCAWHGYEYDVDDGRSPADPSVVRVRAYEVAVRDGFVILMR
jgi:nitrite reductase/ring-hydroxylating ferredoxin subunit